jgi:hypothetical protein
MTATEIIETREEQLVREIKEDQQREVFEREDHLQKMYSVFDSMVSFMGKDGITSEDNMDIVYLFPYHEDYQEKSDGSRVMMKESSILGFIAEFDDLYLWRWYEDTYGETLSIVEVHALTAHILRAITGREAAKGLSQRARFKLDNEGLKTLYGDSVRAYRYKIPKKFIELYILKRKDIAEDADLNVILP